MRNLWVPAALISLALGLTGCDDAKNKETVNAPAASSDSAPKEGGSLIIGITSGDPLAVNPIYASDRTTLTIMQALYAPLYSYNDGKIEWGLAESLEPSADNLSYILKLKPNLTWQDGQPITADDVVFTFNKLLDEKQHSFFRSMFMYGGKPVQVSKVDDLTVKFTLPQVSAAFVGTLVQIYPIPQHVFANENDLEKSGKNDAPVGSGPFKFKEYRAGQYYALTRFDGYWNGKPKLDSVTYRFAKDSNSANLALQNGEINLKMIDPQDVSRLKKTDKFNFVTYPEGRLAYINTNKTQESMGLYIQQQLKALGINVELLPLDANAMSQRSLDMKNTGYELSLGGYIMGSEPDGYKSLFMSNEAYNYAHYKNPQFDALWDKGATETDSAKRGAIYKQLQQVVATDMTYYPIAYSNAAVAVDKRFGGTQEAEPKPVYMFQDLSKIYQK